MSRTLTGEKAPTQTAPGLMRDRDFVKFWAGETVSLFGSQVTTLALPLTAVLVLNATPGQMGLLTAAQFAPFLIVTLFAGVWLDRMRKLPVLVWSNAGRGLLLALVPAGAFAGLLRAEHLYVIVFLIGVLTVFFELAYQTYLPSLLGAGRLVEGNSKLFASASLAEIGGPGLAGVLVAVVTAPFALLLDAVSFVGAAAGLHTIRHREPAASKEEVTPRAHLFTDIREGLKATAGNIYLRVFALEAASYNLFNQVFATLFVLYATRELGLGPEMLGLIFAVGSIGSLLGSIAAPHIERRAGLGRTITVGSAFSCISPLLIPLAPLVEGATVPLLVAAQFLVGMSLAVTNVHIFSLRQALMPAQMRGRMTASYRFVTWGVIPIGAVLSGAAAEVFGLWPTLAGGLLGLSTVWLWLLLSPVSRLRRMSDIVSPEPGYPQRQEPQAA